MDRTVLMSTLLLGCAARPEPLIPPAVRTDAQQLETSVRVDVECVTPDEPLLAAFPGTGVTGIRDDLTGLWTVDSVGSGVMVSGRHALTALHVVRCPYPPSITVFSPWIGSSRAVVDRSEGENARLRLNDASRVIPPLIRDPRFGEMVCTEPSFPYRAEQCGVYQGDLTAELVTTHGNSGAPIYGTDGWLVGLVQTGDGTYTGISTLDEDLIR